jgi:hypothetical protein
MNELEEMIERFNLRERSNKPIVAWKRFYFFVYAKTKGLPLQSIANMVGLESHCTVINGIKQYDNLKNDKLFKAYTREISEEYPLSDIIDFEFYSEISIFTKDYKKLQAIKLEMNPKCKFADVIRKLIENYESK